MKAVFLFFKKVGLGLCILAISFTCAFTATLSFSEEREFSRAFHFVVIVTENLQSVAGLNSLDGGAGYAVNSGIGVAIGVYFSLSAAQTVQAQASAYYTSVALETRRITSLRFTGNREKAYADKIIAAYATFYEYLSLLYQESVRLCEGGTQESSKRILNTVADQLIFLGEINEEVDGKLFSSCIQAGTELKELVKGNVFVKDLRYFLCQYAEEYLSLVQQYAL